MPKIKVTIGLCVKNMHATVEKAIRSVMSQDYSKEQMEIIVVDGSSNDGTTSIVRNCLLNSKIKNLFFIENKGLGSARQMVVDAASGDYILWVDGDMFLTETYVRKQVDFMEKNASVGIAKGRYGFLNEKNLVAYLQNVDYVSKGIDWWGGDSEAKETTKPLGTSGSIHRLKTLKQIGGFNIENRGGYEDTDIERRICMHGALIYVTNAVFFEQHRTTWKGLWDEYFWWGYGAHQVNHVNKGVFLPPFPPIYAMLPPAGFVAGLMRSIVSYDVLYQKRAFLMPFHYAFKRLAWCFGFIKSHFDGYGHD